MEFIGKQYKIIEIEDHSQINYEMIEDNEFLVYRIKKINEYIIITQECNNYLSFTSEKEFNEIINDMISNQMEENNFINEQ